MVLRQPDLRACGRLIVLSDFSVRPSSVVAGLSGLHADRGAAEELLGGLATALRDVAGDSVLACTHLVSQPWRHEAISVEVPEHAERAFRAALFRLDRSVSVVVVGSARAIAGFGAAKQLEGAYEAALGHWDRSQGRAVVFPGQSRLVELAAVDGLVSVRAVIAETAIDSVESTHGAYGDHAMLVTDGFIRPIYRAGQLIVLVGHDDPLRLVPWEVPNPTPCCANH